MKKLVIANVGVAVQGKSSSVKETLKYLIDSGAVPVKGTTAGGWDSDIRMIVIYKGVKIGVESQGDPNSRIYDSIPYFVKEECDIIICACRTYGGTNDEVTNLIKKGHEIIWAPNPKFEDRSHQSIQKLNTIYAKMVVGIVDERIAGQI